MRDKLEGVWSTQHYNIEYQGFLSNHLAHGVVALELLGASEKRIDLFADEYIEKCVSERVRVCVCGSLDVCLGAC